jgi:hypothetical protein
MVPKDMWGHLLVYNLVRAVMAEKAYRKGAQPRELSFQGARQVIKGVGLSLAEPHPLVP